MNLFEARQLWNKSKRRQVRQACQKDPKLYIQVREILSKEDKDFLMARMTRTD